MIRELGSYNTSGTRTHVRFQFSTHAAAGGNVAPSSAFEAADIRIYRANDSAAYSATQRSSANGITMTSPFDSLTGVHDVDIDLTDNTDAGFYAAGYRYSVVLAPDETVDSQTITGVVLAEFEIGPPPANVTQLGGSATPVTNLTTVFSTDFANNYDTTGDCFVCKLDDGVTHGGTTAMLRLGASSTTPALYVTNSHASTPAAKFESSGASASGLNCHNSSSGMGLLVTSDSGTAANFESTTGTGLGIAGSPTACAMSGGTTGLAITGAMSVSGTTSLAAVTTSGTVTLNALTVSNATTLTGNVSLGGTLTVTGAITATNASNNLTLGTFTVTTNAIAWNASWDAEVQSEVQDAIEANNLDHLMKIAVDTNFATTVHLDSVIGQLADNGTTATFDRTTDSLEAIRDRGDAAWITATGFSTLDAAGVRSAVGLSSANLDTQLSTIDTVVDTILVDTNELQTDWANGGRLDVLLDGVVADNPNRPTRGVQLDTLTFTMVDATDFNTPETGITVTATISKDGGSFASCTNSVSEISAGAYKITLTATEMTADNVLLKFTGTGCATRFIQFRTQPT